MNLQTSRIGYNHTYKDMSKDLQTFEEHEHIVDTCIDIFVISLQKYFDEEQVILLPCQLLNFLHHMVIKMDIDI